MNKIIIILFVYLHIAQGEDELWKKDMTNEIEIGPADSGYKRVTLSCGNTTMNVDIEMDEEFSGVIYTRGSFAKKTKHCFKKPKPGLKFKMKIPYDDCQTKKKGEIYKNTLIIQYDDELIMPGDAAFELECDNSPKEITISAAMSTSSEEQSLKSRVSKISLADADPAGKPLPKHRLSTVTGKDGVVSFTPDDVRPRKKKRINDEM